MDNIHFPHHVELDEFVHDYKEKKRATELQEKYKISARQYRLIVRYIRENCRVGRGEYVDKYIYKTGFGKYVVRKRVGGKYGYFGSYASVDDAKGARDELIKNNWRKCDE